MRSPALAFSLFAVAATGAVSAQSNISQSLPVKPHLEANVGSYHTQIPRGYPGATYPHPEDRSDDRGGIARAGHGHPQPPRINEGGAFRPSGGDMDGGVSNTAPAVGADAGSGGQSASSSDSDPASGSDIFRLGSSIQDALGGAQVPQSTGGSQAGQGGTEYKPTQGYAYSPQRMKRVAYRTDSMHNASRRDDSLGGLVLPNEEDNSGSDDNSNQDGADGVSQRGSETDGAGPYGGKAHSGQVGSSEGGHVYNTPATSE